MKIKIDLALLEAQIHECDTKACHASSEEECSLFEGIANLLSEIAFALENGDDIKFDTTK